MKYHVLRCFFGNMCYNIRKANDYDNRMEEDYAKLFIGKSCKKAAAYAADCV